MSFAEKLQHKDDVSGWRQPPNNFIGGFGHQPLGLLVRCQIPENQWGLSDQMGGIENSPDKHEEADESPLFLQFDEGRWPVKILASDRGVKIALSLKD